jgi:dTDP-4-amino-4,6-dideoxygalactose transaminase
MAPIASLCRSKKIYLIEDCAQAHGARYKGNPVGTFGDFGSFSFCQDKIFTTGGEGGLPVTLYPCVLAIFFNDDHIPYGFGSIVGFGKFMK